MLEEANSTIVVALGGNALMSPEAPVSFGGDAATLRQTAAILAQLARRNRLAITHGNGPQIGALARQAVAAPGLPPPSLDLLCAQSQATIGHALVRALAVADGGLRTCCVLTHVDVDSNDPSFARPTKPIGPVLDAAEAEAQARAHGWTMAPDRSGMRRVVPSPQPLRIVELPAIAALLNAGVMPICCGGGGIPIAPGGTTEARIEGVIDKDATSALLAREIGARRLLLLTDVPAVCDAWPGGAQIARATPAGLASLSFAAGTMGPKVEAAASFVAATGGIALIGHLEDAEAVLAGTSGTLVSLNGPAIELRGTRSSGRPDAIA